MQWLADTIREFNGLRSILHVGLADEIETAKKHGWQDDDILRIKVDVRRLLDLSGRLSLVLTVCLFVPLLVTIIFLVRHSPSTPYSFGYTLLGMWSVLIGVAALAIFWPLLTIIKRLRELPDPVFRELIQPLWVKLDLLNICISIALLCYITTSWRFAGTLPIFSVIALLWLFAPIAAFTANRNQLFVKLRLAQLLVLLVVASATMLSPVPVQHFQTWAQHEAANKLRPVNQQEVTASWLTLQWFTQEGLPLVWYSGDMSHGYRLWSSPGNEPSTNEKLKAVADKVTKETIVAAFAAKKAVKENADASDRIRLEEEAKVKEKEVSARLARDFVFPESLNRGSWEDGVLIVLDSRKQEDPALRTRISKVISEGGLDHRVTVFTPAFIASSSFTELLSGKVSSEPLFRIVSYADALLVILTETKIAKERTVESVDMLAADIVWDIRLISARDGRMRYGSKIKVRGVGFKETGAEENAISRAEEELKKLIPSIQTSK